MARLKHTEEYNLLDSVNLCLYTDWVRTKDRLDMLIS